MSRIGNKHIPITAGVDVKIENGIITLSGPKGTLSQATGDLVRAKVEDNAIIFERINDEKHSKQMHGTIRSIVNGMMIGVVDGYKKTLIIEGTGYRCLMQGKNVVMSVGYSHQITVEPLEGVTITVTSPTEITVTGTSKANVGQTAALIRATRKPEPYLGKGVRYAGEKIRRLEGKKAGK